jgi:hypothetical protein
MLNIVVARHFNAFIEKTFKPKESVKNFLLKHERKELCINNLVTALKTLELTKPQLLGKDEVKQISEDFARMFCKAALDYAEEKALSEAERQRRISEAERIKNLEAEYGTDGTSAERVQIRSV